MATVKLDDVACEVRESWKADRAGVPVVGLEHLEPDEIWLRHWDVNPDENTFSKGFKMGQLLFGRRRAYQKKMSIAPCDGICSGDITVIAAKPEKILPELLPFYLRTDAFFDFAMRGSGGSLSPRVKWSHIAGYEFDLPPLDEQRKLADLLWAANDLKEKYKKAIAASDEMLKAKFREMFGGCGEGNGDSRGGAETRKIPRRKIGELCKLMNGFAFQSKNYVSEGIRVIRIANVQKGYIEDLSPVYYPISERESLSQFLLEENDLLLSLTGNVGRVALLQKELLPAGLNQRVACLRIVDASVLDKQFLFSVMNNENFENDCIGSAKGSAQKNMSTEWLKEYEVPTPPLALQQQFVEIARKADETKAALKKSINDVEQVIKGLING